MATLFTVSAFHGKFFMHTCTGHGADNSGVSDL